MLAPITSGQTIFREGIWYYVFSLELHQCSRDYHHQHDFITLNCTGLFGKLVFWIHDSFADSANEANSIGQLCRLTI